MLRFGDVAVGKRFRYGERVLIKIPRMTEVDHITKCYNAIDIFDGTLFSISPLTECPMENDGQ